MTKQEFWDKWKYGFKEIKGTPFQQQRRHDVARVHFFHDLDKVIETAIHNADTQLSWETSDTKKSTAKV